MNPRSASTLVIRNDWLLRIVERYIIPIVAARQEKGSRLSELGFFVGSATFFAGLFDLVSHTSFELTTYYDIRSCLFALVMSTITTVLVGCFLVRIIILLLLKSCPKFIMQVMIKI